jgi:hypothetical protein
MRFTDNRFNESDDFEDFRRYEEYQRQKDMNLLRGIGGFFTKLYLKVFIYFTTYLMLAIVLQRVTDMQDGVTCLISMFLAFFVFKIEYVKNYPGKSLLTLCFLFFLVFVAFDS